MNNSNVKYPVRNKISERYFQLFAVLITFIFVIPYFLFLIFFNALNSFLNQKITLSGEVPIAIGREGGSL
jgi:uncharacterized membrane protein (DUF485 family)